MSPLFAKGILGGRRSERLAPLPVAAGPGDGSASAARPARVPSLVELCSELFSLAYSLRAARDLGDPAEVRRRIHQFLEQLESQGRKAGYTTPQVEEARFAAVALIDEAVLSSQWPGRDAWRANPLQRELFKMNVAGEEFYTRLERLRQNRVENRQVLEVYYACLIMGFEGRYKVLGREKLESLIHAVAGEIAPGAGVKMEDLSPAWRRPDEFLEAVGEGVPVWATALGIVGAVLILILIMSAVARHEAGQAARSIQELLLSAGA